MTDIKTQGYSSCGAPLDGLQYGDFNQARKLALNILDGRDIAHSRTELLKYAVEALRLQPQGEVLLRMGVKKGATIADSRPILMLEALVAILLLENVRRPSARLVESAFPRERRLGRFQLDDDNLYAKTFSLEFDESGTTRQYFRQEHL